MTIIQLADKLKDLNDDLRRSIERLERTADQVHSIPGHQGKATWTIETSRPEWPKGSKEDLDRLATRMEHQ